MYTADRTDQQCLWKILVIIPKNVDFRLATYFYINSANPAAVVWFLYKVMFLFLDSCRPSLTHALAWPRLTNHSLPPKWRWFVCNIISPGLPWLKKKAADKHVFGKLPLVTLFISSYTKNFASLICEQGLEKQERIIVAGPYQVVDIY